MVNSQRSNTPQRSGYRPRVKPADQIEELDSEDEDPEDVIQTSRSIAERRLAALVGARARAYRTNGNGNYSRHNTPIRSPRTVLRNIISKELDEDLQQNLVWERSQNQVQGRPPRAPGSIFPGPWRALNPLRSDENADSQVASTTDRSFSTERTKSWAGDYHAWGW
ncbi:hypothetical protein BU17DRAFT_69550 [Hysterangium stoloniferum]|nr:hypothetical protein BU17DRAFT_69550 [Hysterangium stoloniferum]